MNESDRLAVIQKYLDEVTAQFQSGHAREHSYRPALERLMMTFEKVHAVNEPKHSDHGAPDFVFLSNDNSDLILGYAEAKDIDVSLDKTEKTEQMQRYHGYANLFLTDYLEFRFFRNGDKYETISLGEIKNGALHLTPGNGERLIRELEAFLMQTPEKIRSGKRLAQIMGGKARRIRDNVKAYLEEGGERNGELEKIFEMMKKLLVHDLEPEKFADMYAQTLVYGLFVARYSDTTPESFTRTEARDLVPKSNPFLRHFFDHIVGPSFDTRLGYIVDELCEIFSVSNVQEIVHKHLRIQDETNDSKDPIIHFYEDFLQEYDASERKRMGAYYTPIPVVKYIVRQVDRILKEDFGLAKGLASTDTIDHWVETGQDMRADKRQKIQTGYNIKIPRVQVLDPAVGTATFLNETIKFVHESFKGQEGRWPSYVNDNLLKRLYGFELMMAPYTIAHLKLGMTLKETGVEKLQERLGVYLTNTLEEGVSMQPDLFSFGLAEAVSDESRLAAEVKSEKPVMIVMGNPPYSVSSNNKSKWIQNLIADYKKDLGERKINLDDDYIKFIRFAEEMIAKNGSGVVAMITNNSYIDGITHRQMRKHLLQTFDKIYVLDLHGNSKKKEVVPDGSKDENVFDIMQGVSIVLMVKIGDEQAELGGVYHAELWGKRKDKFATLNDVSRIKFLPVAASSPAYLFTPKNYELSSEYEQLLSLAHLFMVYNSGIKTDRDKLFIDMDRSALTQRISKLFNDGVNDYDFVSRYNVTNSSSYKIVDALKSRSYDEQYVSATQYRPFDYQWIYYDPRVISRPAEKAMKHIKDKNNLALVTTRSNRGVSSGYNFIADKIVDIHELDSAADSLSVMPLYIYHDDGTRTPNFDSAELAKLTANLAAEPSPEDVLDYIYAVLHSPSYREKYKEFLKTDFPRVPVPTQAEFDRLVLLGRQLRELHLMKSPLIDDYDTTFPEAGDNVVEKVKFEDGRVWINDTQYFGNVPELAWDFYIGGYQPAQKWLKDRKSRSLSDTDLDHYQKIIKILLETDRIMKLIDEH